MDKYDRRIKILSILIIILILFMLLLTFAFIKYKNNNTVIDTNSILKVDFVNTSNIAIVNAKSDDEISKTFSIKNISNKKIYYDIKFDNIINNFEDEAIKYNLIGSDNAAYVSNMTISNTNDILVSSIELKSNEEHNYVLKLIINTSNLINKTFSTNIKVTLSNNSISYEHGTLGNKILNENKLLSENVINNDKEVEGLFYTNNSNNGKTIYFFRGTNIINNNVRIDDLCFKIIRTTEQGDIKLIYNGMYENNICLGNNNIIGESEYNSKSNYNAYVGYMYGVPNSSSYKEEHSNVNSSKIKSFLDNYYTKNLSKYSKLFENSYFCNNRKTNKFIINNVVYDVTGYKNNNTGYNSMYNIINNNHNFRCDLDGDQLKMPVLSNPIGTLTVEEAIFAGINNKNCYLDSKIGYWTMSPAYFDGTNAYNYVVKDGKLWQNKVSEKHGVRPVISLKKSTMVKEGNGTGENPYLIEY